MVTGERSLGEILIACLVAFSVVCALLALFCLSLLIFVLWSDYLQIGNVTWQAMIAVHFWWIAIAAGLAALAVSRYRKMHSARKTAFWVAAGIALPSLALAGGATFLQANLPSQPLNTEQDVRPRLETLLKQRVRSIPQFARIDDLDRQIGNIRISGPAMTFEPETTRYVAFKFDTGCGRAVELVAILGSGNPDHLSMTESNACDP
ncbi:MAG: hypothetical protein CMP81_02550 [Fulvimarina sp.]|nr:hypothetical protein [Fulvimarina sp.]